jgi:hypothetical protein
MYKGILALRTFTSLLNPLKRNTISRRTMASISSSPLLKKPVKLALVQLASGASLVPLPNSTPPTKTWALKLTRNHYCRCGQSRQPPTRPLQSPRGRLRRRPPYRTPRMFQLALRLRLLPLLRGNTPPLPTTSISIALFPRALVHGVRS